MINQSISDQPKVLGIVKVIFLGVIPGLIPGYLEVFWSDCRHDPVLNPQQVLLPIQVVPQDCPSE